MRTIGSELDRYKGVGPGFDTMRVTLALAIVVFHSVGVSLGKPANVRLWASPYGALATALLPAFFALSGFLVMGSVLRTPSLKGFLGLRALRIIPALATEIALSALVLGPLFTSLPLHQYLTDHRFLEYFGSLIGRIRTVLPGVFAANPMPDLVNMSLWTIRPELACYVYLALLILTGRVRSLRLLLTIALAVALFNTGADWLVPPPADPASVPARLLLMSFIAGNAIFALRHRIPFHIGLFVAMLASGLVLVRLSQFNTVCMLALAYCTAYLGLVALPRLPLFSRGDYSYGIYLYGFPVQQAQSYLFPNLRNPLWNLAIALPPIILLAVLSWHYLEKPVLRLRKRLAVVRDAPKASRRTVGLLGAALGCYFAYLMNFASLLRVPSEAVSTVLLMVAALSGLLAYASIRQSARERSQTLPAQ